MSKSINLRLIASIREFIKDRFNLEDDKANENEIIESVRKGVEFKGTNLWVLIFAIFIASVGLNVNSTAVIIGAMLISPLMGPIMGIGLAVGINDFELMKKSFKNLAIAVFISVLTSSVYFLISPLGDAQSELLARTTPTIWDVLIALFGGLAGIVAASRKEKSNVVPGVAIATALMPPLCTAGFGIAKGNLDYTLGAFYLFFINSVFISFATILIVRYLKFSKKEFVSREIEKRVKQSILVIVAITLIPSVFMAYNIVKRSLFEKNVKDFLTNELNFESAQIVSKNISYKGDKNIIDVILLGEIIDDDLIENAKSKMSHYGISDAKLNIKQVASSDYKADFSLLRAGIIEDLYQKNEEIIKTKDQKITLLESELIKLRLVSYPVEDISREAYVQHKNLKEFFIQKSVLAETDSNKFDTLTIAYANFKKRPGNEEKKRLEDWLKVRTKTDKIKLIVQ